MLFKSTTVGNVPETLPIDIRSQLTVINHRPIPVERMGGPSHRIHLLWEGYNASRMVVRLPRVEVTLSTYKRLEQIRFAIGIIGLGIFVLALLIDWWGLGITIEALSLFPKNSGFFILAYLVAVGYIVTRIASRIADPY